jgi:hypothetical protein
VFVKDARGGYNRHGEQFAYGWFLLIFQRDWTPGAEPQPLELRACIRYAHLAQCGHFMMGTVSVGACRISLSGSYGHDGLPLTAPAGIWERLHPVPKDLQDAFWSGGGHNSAGSEAPALRAWALAHFKDLHDAGSARYKRRPHAEETSGGSAAPEENPGT